MPSLDIIKIVQQNYTTKFVEIQRIFDTLFLNRLSVVTTRLLGKHRQRIDEKSAHYVTRLEYIRSCEELWQKGMYIELHAYQHHVFMDWRFVDDKKWQAIHDALNGAGVESMQAKWDEMFGEKKEEEAVEEVKVKKPRRKAVAKKKAANASEPATAVTRKSRAKKKVSTKKPVKKLPSK